MGDFANECWKVYINRPLPKMLLKYIIVLGNKS